MAYICFSCKAEVGEEYTRIRVRCPYCGNKLLLKTRSDSVTVKAR